MRGGIQLSAQGPIGADDENLLPAADGLASQVDDAGVTVTWGGVGGNRAVPPGEVTRLAGQRPGRTLDDERHRRKQPVEPADMYVAGQ